MTDPAATRTLYLTRHGEAGADEQALTPAGVRQAELLGQRLRSVALSAVTHGPLPPAVQTAHLIARHLPEASVSASEAAGDYVPDLPEPTEAPAEVASLAGLFDDVSPAEKDRGRQLAREALEQFAGPAVGADRNELVVTHAFTIAWLVRDALGSSPWRWLGLNHAHAALTVIRYTPGRPSTLLCFNDMAHLSTELRWTGFPPELRL